MSFLQINCFVGKKIEMRIFVCYDSINLRTTMREERGKKTTEML